MTTYEELEDSPFAIWARWLVPTFAFIFVWWIIPMFAPEAPLEWIVTDKASWYINRASGMVGYLLLALSTIWGLLLSTKLIKKVVPPMLSLAMHNYLSWTAVGFTVLHMIVLLFDSYYEYTVGDLLIPFTGPYSPTWVGMGTIGFYIMLATSASWYFRKQIGQNNWRRLHYLTFGAYGLSTIHGVMAGTDTSQLMPMYIGSVLIVVFLTAYRMITAVNE